MRVKIKGKITKARASVISDDELTDQILSYQREEIAKVENPYRSITFQWGFDCCLQKILALLK